MQEFRERMHYYSNKDFRHYDRALKKAYRFHSPYAIHVQDHINRGILEDIPYGETPLCTLERIAKAAGWGEGDQIYELGCGRGRVALWLRCFKGCRVIAVDQVKPFVERGQEVTRGMEGLEFVHEDIRALDYSLATGIYLYGSALSDSVIRSTIKAMESLKRGVRVVTISYPLTDYTEDPRWKLIDQIAVAFPWGKTTAFIHEVVR